MVCLFQLVVWGLLAPVVQSAATTSGTTVEATTTPAVTADEGITSTSTNILEEVIDVSSNPTAALVGVAVGLVILVAAFWQCFKWFTSPKRAPAPLLADTELTEGETICCWQKLIVGQACCLYNFLCCPFVLCIWATSLYLCGCLRVYMNRGLYKFCCCICRACDCCWHYNDPDFKPEDASLGNVKGDSAGDEGRQFSGKVTWVRGKNFPVEKDKKGRKRHMQLFSREIDSRDICQGALGDCWLLAAIACLAEHDGAIQAVFRTKEANPRGKYVLRLYDGAKEKWEIITIDDYIPCNKANHDRDGSCKPFFSKPKHNELYVMLLEKAFAKFCGGYSALEGGQTIWAIRAMTGDPARQFSSVDKQKWQRQDLKNFDDPKDKRKCGLYSTSEYIDNDTMFEILRKYHSLGSVLSASGASGKDGLVTGHAYSILNVRKVNDGFLGIGGTDYKMIQIRNPWGQGEWKGDWSDKSDLWEKHKAVKKALEYEDKDDGAFWMSWKDFIENWSRIGVVDRTVDINTVRLHVKDDSACAPVFACCRGCGYFWCLCQGCKKVYCPHRSSSETVKVNKGCCHIL